MRLVEYHTYKGEIMSNRRKSGNSEGRTLNAMKIKRKKDEKLCQGLLHFINKKRNSLKFSCY